MTKKVTLKMEELEIKQEFCIFCFKNVEECSPSKERKDIHHFITMMERHLKSDLGRDKGESSRNKFLLEGRCCEDCYRIVNSFCDLYCQIKNLELKINWKMRNLANVMSSADKVPSRVERFRNSFRTENCGEVERNLYENVMTSRKRLIDNCARKLRHSYPKLTITKCDENQPNVLPELTNLTKEKCDDKLKNINVQNQLLNSINPREVPTIRSRKVVVSTSTWTPPLKPLSSTLALFKISLENSTKESQKTTPVHYTSPIVIEHVEAFANKNTLKNQNNINTRSKLQCNKCPRIFSTRLQLKFHQNSHLRRNKTSQEFRNVQNQSANEPRIIRQDEDARNIESSEKNHTAEEEVSFQETSLVDFQTDLDDVPRGVDLVFNIQEPICSSSAADNLNQSKCETKTTTDLYDGDDEPRVDFELSDCKFNHFSSSDLLVGGKDDPPAWEISPETLIESTAVMLAVVDDTKQESPICSPGFPIPTDFHTNEVEVPAETPCVTSNSSKDDSASLMFPDTEYISQTSEINSFHQSIPCTRSPSKEMKVIPRRLLRTVYKCGQCCKTFSNQEKQLIHQKSHLQQVDEDDDDMLSVNDEDKSEDDFDPGFEKDLDSCSSIHDNQEDPEDGKRTLVILDVMDSKLEPSTSSNPFVDEAPRSTDEVAEEESFPSEMEVDNINSNVRNNQESVPSSSSETKTKKTRGHHRRLSDISTNLSQNNNSDKWVPAKSIKELLIYKYSCSEADCCKNFVLEEELENHKKQHGIFQCEGCPKTKHFARDLAIHEAKHSSKPVTGKTTGVGDNLWQCFRCDFSTRTTSYYVHHHLTKHSQVPSTVRMCPICRKSLYGDTRREMALEKHFKVYHDVSDMDPESVPKCSKCLAYFRTEIQLQIHKNSLCKNPCPDCGKNFSRNSALAKHRLKQHIKNNTPLPHKCKEEKCGKEFEAKVDLELHTKNFHFQGWNSQVQCSICGKQVFHKSFKSHVFSAHKKIQPKKSVCEKSVCEKCGKTFKDNATLRNHYLTHTGPKSWKFSCSICGRKCRAKGKLVAHEKTHKKEKSFVCQVCGVSYAHRHNLRIHVNNKHSDVIQDIPQPRNKGNMTSRKGIKCKAFFDKVNDTNDTIDEDLSD